MRDKPSDALSYDAADRRVAKLFFYCNLAVLLLSLGFLVAETIRDINQLQSNNSYFYIVCVFISCLSLAVVRTKLAILDYIILSHVTVLYVGTTFIYGLANQKWPADWFRDPSRSANVAAVYEIAVVFAYFAFRSIANSSYFAKYLRIKRYPDSQAFPGFVRLRYLFIAFGLLGAILGRSSEGGSGAAAMLGSFLWVGLASHLALRGRLYPIDALSGCVLILYFSLAIATNQRSAIFEVALFFIFAHIIYSRQAISLPAAIIGVFLARVMTLFSDIALAARDYKAAGFDPYANEILRLSLSSETLRALVDPTFSHPAKLLNEARALYSPSAYSIPFFDGSASLMQRFTLLAEMDSIMHLFDPVSIKWDELKNLIYCVLPPLGQTKDLILSDRIIWEAGARSYGNVGRPMVTAAGEFFYIGGYGGLLMISFVTFFTLFIALRLLRATCRDRALGDLLSLHYLFQTLVTTTAISLCGNAFRTIFLDVAMLTAVNYLSGCVSRQNRNAGLPKKPFVLPLRS